MRHSRSLVIFALVAALPIFAATITSACTISSAMVSGKFNDAGHFEIVSAHDAQGNALQGVTGSVIPAVSTADDVTMAASDRVGEMIYLVGDLNPDSKTLHVASYTQCEKTAQATMAAARTASNANASSCGSKAVKSASAQVANAPSCGSKAIKSASAQVANAAGCGSKAVKSASAQVAGAAGCGSKAVKSASAQVAGAAGCGSKAASAAGCGSKAASAAGCCPSGKSAAAASKVVSAPSTDAVQAGTLIVFNVSGLTCGGCVSKIESAVAALEIKGVSGCTVSLENNQAVVTVTEDVDKEVLQKAIVDAGFQAEIADGVAEATRS